MTFSAIEFLYSIFSENYKLVYRTVIEMIVLNWIDAEIRAKDNFDKVLGFRPGYYMQKNYGLTVTTSPAPAEHVGAV